MASFVDSISSPRSSQELPNAPSPTLPLLHGNDALSSSSALAPPIALPVIPGRSPRKPFVETQPPRSTFGSDHGGSCNAADVSAIPRVKKPAWNVPSNSVIEPGSVMDTISWPALSESARASPKSSSYDSPRALSEGSISALPISSVPSPSSKHALNNQNLNSAQNSPSPRGKTTKDGTVTGGGSNISGASNDTLAVPSSLPALTEASQLVSGKQSSPENSPQGLPNQNNNTDYDRDNNSKGGGFSSHSHGGNDHHRGYGGGRRGGNGHHGNYGNRRNTERGGYEWSPRNFARGFHMQQLHQQRGVGPYLRSPSVTTAPFITPPPPPRPFPNHMGFPDFQSPIYYVTAPQHPESLRGIPFASHPAPTQQVMLLPAADPQCAMLLKQIDYYFSPENLCKDLYLRQNMDEQGWVPISLIAGFNRDSYLFDSTLGCRFSDLFAFHYIQVRQLTNSIQYIIDTVQLSSVVEVQGDKIRKRNDWMAWVLHPVDSMAPASGMQFPGANFDGLAARFDNIYLNLDAPDSAGPDKSEAAFARSSSAKLNGMRNSEGGDGTQAGSYSDRIWNMRTLLRSDTM